MPDNNFGIIKCNGENCQFYTDCYLCKPDASESLKGHQFCPFYVTNFDKLTTMSKDELAQWFHDEFGDREGNPWDRWVDKTFCNNCEGIRGDPENPEQVDMFGNPMLFAPCELHDCPYNVADLNDLTVIKLWLSNTEEI